MPSKFHQTSNWAGIDNNAEHLEGIGALGTASNKPCATSFRGGFFENDDDFCQALIDGGFIKVLQVRKFVLGLWGVYAVSMAHNVTCRFEAEKSHITHGLNYGKGSLLTYVRIHTVSCTVSMIEW